MFGLFVTAFNVMTALARLILQPIYAKCPSSGKLQNTAMLHCSLHQGFVNQAPALSCTKEMESLSPPLDSEWTVTSFDTLFVELGAIRGFFLLLLLLGSCPAIATATQLAEWRQTWGQANPPKIRGWGHHGSALSQPPAQPSPADHRSKSTQLQSAQPGLEQQEPQETALCRLVNAIYFQIAKFEQLVMGH